MRIKRDDTVAFVIDFQERLYPFIHEYEKLTMNVVRLIKGLNVLGIKMIVTEQYSKGLGHTIPEIQEALGNYEPVEKSTFSSCGSKEVYDNLIQFEKKNVIVIGIESHVCVLQTTIDLIAMGYKPVLIEDCVSSRNINDKIWGFWGPDDKSPLIWNNTQTLLTKYGLRLDIIYEDPEDIYWMLFDNFSDILIINEIEFIKNINKHTQDTL